MTPTSNPKFLKLQLGLISISDIDWVKRKVPLLDSLQLSLMGFIGSLMGLRKDFAVRMAEIFPGQKWSISNL